MTPSRSHPGRSLAVGAGAVLALVVLAFGALGALRGFGIVSTGSDPPGSPGPSEADRSITAPPVTVPAVTTSSVTTGGAVPAAAPAVAGDEVAGVALGDERPVVRGPEVSLVAERDDAGWPGPDDVVSGLAPSTVVFLRVEGFDSFATAMARQCVTVVMTTCGNTLPIQFGEDGRASVQYLVSDEFLGAQGVPGGCRAGAAPCTLVVEATDGSRRAMRPMVFGPDLVPGTITVTPRRGLVDGQTVQVAVAGFPPGATLVAMACAPPAINGTERCGSPGGTAPLAVGADGTGVTDLVVHSGPLGRAGAACGRRDPCAISVAGDGIVPRAAVVPLAFAAPPGADYDAGRLLVGGAVAVLLLALAAVVVRRTDWALVGESAAAAIDDVEYADLEAIVAAQDAAEEAEATGEAHDETSSRRHPAGRPARLSR